MKHFYLAISCLLLSIVAFSQATQTPGITVGLLYTEDCKVADGYTLYSPQYSPYAYLIDNCGYVVNQWTFSGGTNYTGTYLLEDGSCIKIVASSGGVATYGSGNLERRAWDNTLMWDYAGTGIYVGIHSDLGQLPNGNIIAVVQRQHTASEAVAKGINPNNFGSFYKTESVIEIEPTGLTTGNIVWEWHLWDHIIQDINSAVTATYANIGDNPGKFDGNLINGQSHFNSLNYMEDRDHILLSNWLNDEIYIIDHNTTTAEAAGTQGDFLWRWGNPQTYDKGTGSDKKLDGQHNPKLISSSYAVHGGKISVFNNGFSGLPGNPGNGSGSCIINAVYDSITNTYAVDPATGAWLPVTYDYAWYGDIFPGDNMSSGIMGGVDVQANGNILTTEATSGRLSEVDINGDVVWVYKTPDSGGSIANQGNSSGGGIYKIDKYSPTYPGILYTTAGSLVENNNAVSLACNAGPNTNLDAGIVTIENDNESIGLSCGSVASPVVSIYNFGITDITSLDIEYSVDGGPVTTYYWTGNIPYCSSTQTITLNDIQLGSGSSTLTAEIVSINGQATDDNAANNIKTADFFGSLFVDSGGTQGTYNNNELQTYVICPDNPILEKIEIEFLFVDIEVNTSGNGIQEGCWDFLTIYDGNTTGGSIIANTLCGELSGSGQTPSNSNSLLTPGDMFTSTDPTGCLTVVFDSDGSVTDDGWEAGINCIDNGNNCQATFNLTGDVISGVYQADNIVISDGNVNSAVSNGDVEYNAGDQYIDLIMGFDADGSVGFTADIIDCNPEN